MADERWIPDVGVEPLPCPFCGHGELGKMWTEYDDVIVYCLGCSGAMVLWDEGNYTGYGPRLSEDERSRRILAAWNRRVTPPAGPPPTGR